MATHPEGPRKTDGGGKAGNSDPATEEDRNRKEQEEEALDEALDESFPASDPPVQP